MDRLPAPETGLSPEEAAARLRAFGPNEIARRDRWAELRERLGVLGDPMAGMLLVAALVYLLAGETRDGLVLLAALVPVLGVDVFLEARSRGALDAMARAVAPRARVIRGGREIEVDGAALVPGDRLVLAEGDVLRADGVVRDGVHLAMDEAPLTGESVPRAKRPHAGAAEDAPEEARFFAGSLVLAGHGHGEIVVTGPSTRFGRVAHLVARAGGDPTPLQVKTGRLVRGLLGAAILVALAVVALSLARGASPLAAILAGISLAMAAIPEEFPLVLTLFLSLGAWRLGRRGVLVKRLASVETLGATTVICTDKTGTLTLGHFTLDAHHPLDAAVGEHGLLEAAVLACEPRPADMLERELVAHAEADGIDPAALHARWRLAYDHPFDPDGKHMTHVWAPVDAAGDARLRVVAKGALEGLLAHAAASPDERAAAEAAQRDLAGQGMRVLAVAERWMTGPADAPPSEDAAGRRAADERDLRIVGLLGFRDPLRPGVPAAVAECRAAGIAVKLITGDGAITAHAIAEAAGIVDAPTQVLTGPALDALDPAAFDDRVVASTLFARVRPEQKHAIVDALRRAGAIVAMTGDGINDAPALRHADIGVSMGARASDVARAAADLVLLRDSFADLVATVREGRHIFANIQRAFAFVIGFHLPIVGLALLAPLLGLPYILRPIHLVWLELIVHPVAALVFEGEPAPPDVMGRPPRHPAAPLLSTREVLPALLSGSLLTLCALGLFIARLDAGEPYARGAALATIVLGAAALTWAERAGDRPWRSVGWPRSARFWVVIALVVLSIPLGMAVPALRAGLDIAPITPRDAALCAVLAGLTVVWRAPFGWPGRRRAAP